LATDPDCDRVGCAAPDRSGAWRTFTGNQIAGLLTEYVLDACRAANSLSPKHYVAKTLVTTELVRRIANSFGVRTVGDLHVGFKWIGEAIDEEGPEWFLFGAEESHGYLAGTHARDKDGAVAALLLAELAAVAKQQGKTLIEKLDALFWQHGCHVERTMSLTAGRGLEGMERMKQLMAQFRSAAPRTLGGLAVTALRDYAAATTVRYGVDRSAVVQPEKLATPKAEMLMFDLAPPGNYIAIRPSGTEPKVKFYMFAFEPPEQLANLEDAKRALTARLDAVEADLRAIAK
jgi:phosphoglucomutase/phosphomannomutase